MESKNKDKYTATTVIGIIGNKWNLLIIWHLKHQTLRFTELQKKMYNANPKTITKHLRDLEENKIIKRVVYAEVPPKVEYSLTEAGIAFIPLLESILEWGTQYMGFKIDEYLK
jgi:DNA-binding HxlR family transcriptional regulator